MAVRSLRIYATQLVNRGTAAVVAVVVVVDSSRTIHRLQACQDLRYASKFTGLQLARASRLLRIMSTLRSAKDMNGENVLISAVGQSF